MKTYAAGEIACLTGAFICCAFLLLAGCGRQVPRSTTVEIMGGMQVSHDGHYVALYTCLTDAAGALLGNEMIVADLADREVVYHSGLGSVLQRPLDWHPARDILLVSRYSWSASELILFTVGPDQPQPAYLAADGLDLLKAVWSPDGSEFVCEAVPDGEGPDARSVYRLTVDAASASATPVRSSEDTTLAAVRPSSGTGYLIFLTRGHRGHGTYTQTIWVAHTDTGRVEQIVPDDWSIVSLDDVSADGTRLALRRRAGGASAEMLAYDWNAHADPKVLPSPDDSILSSMWSPDGNQLLCVGRDHLWLWDIEAAKLERVPFELWSSLGGHAPVAWLPYGRKLAAGVGSRLFIVDLTNGSSIEVVDLSTR